MGTEKGVKLDEDKIRLDLVDPCLIEGVGEVLTFGARKYTPNGWQHVPDAKQRYEAALMRHFMDYKKSERLDKESNLSHLKHMATNVMFLLWFEEQEIIKENLVKITNVNKQTKKSV